MKSGKDFDNANNYTDLIHLEDRKARFGDMIIVKDDGNWKLKQICIEKYKKILKTRLLSSENNLACTLLFYSLIHFSKIA